MRSALKRLAVSALAVVGLLLVAAPLATGATFTATPQAQTTDGAGPFTWSFVSNGEPAYSWVAYKLSTDANWHRCVPNGVVTIENLPIGTYSIEITDDVNVENFSARGLGRSGFTQPCMESSPPPSPYARSISSFSVIAPPVITSPAAPTTSPTAPITSPTTPAATGQTGPPPQAPSTGDVNQGPSEACRTARQTARNIRARYLQALRRAAREVSSPKRKFWRGVAAHRREGLERQVKVAKKQCSK